MGDENVKESISGELLEQLTDFNGENREYVLLDREIDRLTEMWTLMLKKNEPGRYVLEQELKTVRNRLWELLKIGKYAEKAGPEAKKEEDVF